MLYVPSQDIWLPDIVLFNKFVDTILDFTRTYLRILRSSTLTVLTANTR